MREKTFQLLTILCIALVLMAFSSKSHALQVQAFSSEDISNNYVFVRAAMSGTITRLDGSTSDYKVPLWYVTPKECTQDNVGVIAAVEPLHFAGGASFLSNLSDAEERFDLKAIADGADIFLDDRWLWGTVLSASFLLDIYRNTDLNGIIIDDSYFINGPEDGYHMLKEASLFFRQLCHVEKTILVGDSFSGVTARSFYFLHLNTQLATDPHIFTAGKVFDGSIQIGVDNLCFDTTGGPFTCNGPPPDEEGKAMSILSEYDVINAYHIPGLGFFKGVAVRGSSAESRHYEVPGMAHLYFKDTPFILGDVTLRDSQVPDFADIRWFLRATVDNMRRWLMENTAPPASAYIAGDILKNPRPPFGFIPSAFLPPRFDLSLDGDLNADGGVRLPFIEVPLGLHRGMGCDNSNFITDPFSCSTFHTFGIFTNAGTFTPYPALEEEFAAHKLPNPCHSYTSRQVYLGKVQTAAEQAVQQRWILPEDIPAIVDQADKNADEKAPGCVPPP